MSASEKKRDGETRRRGETLLRATILPAPRRLVALSPRLLLVLSFVAFAIWSASAQGTFSNRLASDNVCTVCHSDKQVELQGSTHAREGIKCVDCHGGDPTAQTVAGAHINNFRRSFDRKQIVELCATCHSDQAKMKPYGIPTDQFALYRTSVHGQKWAQGDARVAVCSDCHGHHRVLAADDPKSPVFRENIPQTCGKCHANAEMMTSLRPVIEHGRRL